MREYLKRFSYMFRSTDYFDKVYDAAYHRGLREGQDFGERVAHNRTLALELPRILSRYSQLQLRVMNKRPAEIKKALSDFQDRELERLKMDLQER